MAATRPVQCLDLPIVFPHACLGCGSGTKRDYFVDLGLDLDHTNFQPLWDGAIYLCSVCMENLIVDYRRALNHYEENKNGSGTTGTVEPDQSDSGNVDGSSNESDETSGELPGDVVKSEPPIAATLDSTPFIPISF